MRKVYKNGKTMEYNDAPGALKILKSFGWKEKKPKTKVESLDDKKVIREKDLSSGLDEVKKD